MMIMIEPRKPEGGCDRERALESRWVLVTRRGHVDGEYQWEGLQAMPGRLHQSCWNFASKLARDPA
eukprot:1433675-Rhodomonas_salina.1